ncbi:hypothetical protein K1T71_008092 [Dendrolimus kikuchii]|uniref:Uncharacterized protein n=1 Tax=Dendrolimus kikuchii TaxID=765133 RepID=A0ACC1CX49_9NEOP|nr:hypothetical protein K1T71_008092 [Dendrolimus kikuchii]
MDEEHDVLDTTQLCYEGGFDEQVANLLKSVRLTRQEVENLSQLFDDLEGALQNTWPGCRVIPFGSIVTGMGIRTSDVDCYIELPSFVLRKRSLVVTARNVLGKYPQIFQNLFAVVSAKVPIVKLHHVPTNRHCDVNFHSVTGVRNTKLLAFLLHLDKRALTLAIIIKYWSKVHAITGTNLMPSYAMMHLVIFYLQQEKVLPPICELQKHVPPEITDHWNTAFDDRTPYVSCNNKSLYHLLGGFFKFYNKFNFFESVISMYEGRALNKKEFENVDRVSDIYYLYKDNVRKDYCKMLRIDSYMCVQDPFELNRNLTVAVYPKLTQRILDYFKSASSAYENETRNNFLKVILTRTHKDDFLVKPKTFNDHEALLQKQKLINRPHARKKGFKSNKFNKKAFKNRFTIMFEQLHQKKAGKS